MAGEMILHSDLNCFYASVEMNENPYLRGKAIAVCGSTEERHGIVLTASAEAKARGVKTGMANWEARRACPPPLPPGKPGWRISFSSSGIGSWAVF